MDTTKLTNLPLNTLGLRGQRVSAFCLDSEHADVIYSWYEHISHANGIKIASVLGPDSTSVVHPYQREAYAVNITEVRRHYYQSWLHILQVQLFDAGTYSCDTTFMSTPFEVVVLDGRPNCGSNVTMGEAEEGSTVAFWCSVFYKGKSNPTMFWYDHADVKMPRVETLSMCDASHIGHVNSTMSVVVARDHAVNVFTMRLEYPLPVKKLFTEMGGSNWQRAENVPKYDYKMLTHKTEPLQVLYRPNISVGLTNATKLVEGEYLTLEVDANPPVHRIECTHAKMGLTFYGPKILLAEGMVGDSVFECVGFNYYLGDYQNGTAVLKLSVELASEMEPSIGDESKQTLLKAFLGVFALILLIAFVVLCVQFVKLKRRALAATLDRSDVGGDDD